jgi:hypothetical protein
MKDSLKTFIVAGIPFGIIMGAFVGITNNPYAGIIAGIILGFLFGLSISAFVSIQSKKFKKSSSLITDDKNTIMEGVANHSKGAESVGGWLCLTEKEIVFKSHNFNIQKHKTVIPLNQITEVKTSLTLGFVPNGLQIITNSSVEKFVVNKRKDWVQKINAAILAQQKGYSSNVTGDGLE